MKKNLLVAGLSLWISLPAMAQYRGDDARDEPGMRGSILRAEEAPTHYYYDEDREDDDDAVWWRRQQETEEENENGDLPMNRDD